MREKIIARLKEIREVCNKVNSCPLDCIGTDLCNCLGCRSIPDKWTDKYIEQYADSLIRPLTALGIEV
jgi:hypothetical protein